MTVYEFIKQHNYINYCEAVVFENGDVDYVLPSHTSYLEKLTKMPVEELYKIMPATASPLHWLSEHLNVVVVWHNSVIFPVNYTQKQYKTIIKLMDRGIISRQPTIEISSEKSICEIFEKRTKKYKKLIKQINRASKICKNDKK